MIEKIKDVIENSNGFMKDNEFKIISLNEKECVMEYIVKDNALNPYGMVHGGILFGFADSAAASLACMSGKYPVTIDCGVHYMNAAKCKKLIAKASLLKLGNNIGFYKVDIFDENDTLICSSNIDMYLKKIDK